MQSSSPGTVFAHRRALRAARALAGICFAAAAAFCAAQGPPASERPGATPAAPASIVAQPEAPATPALSQPAKDAPPGKEAPAATAKAVIALVLPLEAGDYARAADAVRAGFLAAADAAGARDRVVVVGHGDGDVVEAFDKAASAGARVVVGPLVRDHLRLLVASDRTLPWTIALNQLDDGVALPLRVYTLALAIESDARVIARRARDEGATSVAVDAPLMKRFASAFAGEWLLVGGDAPQSFRLDPTPDGLAALRRDLGKAPVDAVVIAAEGADASLVKSFTPRVKTYASGQINQRQAPATLRDLEDVRLVDLPWLVTPDAPEFAKLPHRDYPNPALDRLYALGLDAFRVAQAFVDGVPESFALEGATGRLTLTEGRQVAREGRLGVFRGGRLVPLDAR
jgi:outer membrane PBP1 activator LpoA protein